MPASCFHLVCRRPVGGQAVVRARQMMPHGLARPRRIAGRDSLDDAVVLRNGGLPRSEEHTSELQSLMRISYAVFCLKKKKKHKTTQHVNSQVQTKHNKID